MHGLPYEMFKFRGNTVIGILELYKRVWNQEKVPSKWNKSRVVLLHKGGHKNKKSKKKNYRPIALMDAVGIFFT